MVAHCLLGKLSSTRIGYHFVDVSDCYISFEHPRRTDWMLDDGSALPSRKAFLNSHYNPGTRTFTGRVSWEPTTWNGEQFWEYEMVFSENFLSVVAGQVYHFLPNGSPKLVYVQDSKTSPAIELDVLDEGVRKCPEVA